VAELIKDGVYRIKDPDLNYLSVILLFDGIPFTLFDGRLPTRLSA